MLSHQTESSHNTNRKTLVLAGILTFCGAFLVGPAVAIGYVKWQDQQQQLAQMAETLDKMKQSQMENDQTEEVTRAVPDDLLSVPAALQTPLAEPASAPAPSLAPPPVESETVSAAAVVTPTPEGYLSTADKLRALTAAALEGRSSPKPENTAIETASPLEALAVIHAGVQDMVDAVVAGQYDIQTNYEDEHFSGRIYVAFVGQEKDQVALETYLSKAAKAGIVAHSSSVVDGDGSVNGHVLLYDLVERALENGTFEQQRAGQRLRSEALVALTKAPTSAAKVTNAAGAQVYTVQPGDSLAYIALQFYGNTNDSVRISNANRSQLGSTDRIRVGQELLIPTT